MASVDPRHITLFKAVAGLDALIAVGLFAAILAGWTTLPIIIPLLLLAGAGGLWLAAGAMARKQGGA